MMYLLALGGFVLLFAGGELLVRGAVAVARRFGLSQLLIGMTVVAFATSAPELVVSLQATLGGQPDLALGNVVGSNIANVLLILGAAALVKPMRFDTREVRRDTLVMLGASLALVVVTRGSVVGSSTGITFVLAILGYIGYSYWVEVYRDAPGRLLHEHEAEEFSHVTRKLWLGIANIAVGLVGLVAGSRMLVTGATEIARSFGIPEAVIGLTLVAIGTSLPELAASLIAAIRGHSDVAIGNVLGSNVFNVLAILGITSMVAPVNVGASIAGFDVFVALFVALALVPFLLYRGRIGRVAGAGFVVAYVAYTVVLYTGIVPGA